MRNKWLLVIGCWLLAGSAFALTVDTPLPDAVQEAQAKALFQEIRCMVCAGEAIADSPAEVAHDMRRDIRARIAAGDSNATIKAYLVSRYGDAVLMRPPLKTSTLTLWLAPLALLLAGIALARRVFST